MGGCQVPRVLSECEVLTERPQIKEQKEAEPRNELYPESSQIDSKNTVRAA
jgi:hypothetical protein